MAIPISGEPLWGDAAFVDPGAPTTGGGTTGTGGGTVNTGGSGGGSLGVHKYWRLFFTSTYTGANGGDPTTLRGVQVTEWKPFDSSGAAINLTGVIVGASSQYGGGSYAQPINVIDGNFATWWVSSGLNSTEWLSLTFLTPVNIDHFLLAYNWGGVGYPPYTFQIQYSDTGAVGSWQNGYTYTGGMVYAGSYQNTFYTGGVQYRVSVTGNQGGSQVSFSGIQFKNPSGVIIPLSAIGTGMMSSFDGGSSFETNDFTKSYNQGCQNWNSSHDAPSGGAPQSITYQFADPTIQIASISLQAANWTNGIADAPVTFTLAQSFDGVTFTTLGTFTAATWTSLCQTQTFNVTVTPPSTASIVINPPQGLQAQTLSEVITGTATHFDATTQVTFSGTGLVVSKLTIVSATSLAFTLAIAGNAQIGNYTVTASTGTEAPSTSYTVLPSLAVLTALIRGDIGWSQVRMGRDGRWGKGGYGCSTDGSFVTGDIPKVNADGTLVGSGIAASSLTSGTTAGTTGGTTAGGVNGTPAGNGGVQGVNGGTGGTGVGTQPSPNGLISISGSVTPPPTGVRITLSNTTGALASTTTDASGNFQINAPSAGSFTITPSLAGFTFAPASKSVTIIDTSTPTLTAPFVATPVTSGTGSNAVADQIFADMSGPNEAPPHGVPANFDFASGPVIGTGIKLGTNKAAEFWFAAYQNANTPSTSSNTRIEVKSMQFWWLRASTGQWVKGLDPATSAAALSGGYYNENFSGSQLANITYRAESDGGQSLVMQPNEVSHGFEPFPRIPIDSTDLGGVVSLMFARLVLNNTAGVDDRAQAHYVAGVGADPYPNVNAAGANNITAIANGKMKVVTNSYRSFAMTTMTQQQLRDNPPPINLTGIAP